VASEKKQHRNHGINKFANLTLLGYNKVWLISRIPIQLPKSHDSKWDNCNAHITGRIVMR